MKVISAIIISLFLSISTSVAQDTGNHKPFVLGQVDEIQSKQLGEKRLLNIYLPDGYNNG